MFLLLRGVYFFQTASISLRLSVTDFRIITIIYYLCYYVYRASHPDDTNEKTAALKYLLNNNLINWLQKIIGQSVPGYEVAGCIEIIVNETQESYVKVVIIITS